MKESIATTELLQSTLSAYTEEYRELNDTWKYLDNKAQGNIAVSGIFLAGVFAFVRALSATSALYEKEFLTGAVITLLLSVACAILVLRIRKFRGAPLGDTLNRLIQDLLGSKETGSTERFDNFLQDQVKMWSRVNKQLHSVNQSKATYLFWSQVFLLVAIGIVAVLTIFSIYRCGGL